MAGFSVDESAVLKGCSLGSEVSVTWKAYWMVELWNKADAICPVYDIKFEQQQGKAKGIFMPVALFGIGEIGARAVSNCKLNRVR